MTSLPIHCQRYFHNLNNICFCTKNAQLLHSFSIPFLACVPTHCQRYCDNNNSNNIFRYLSCILFPKITADRHVSIHYDRNYCDVLHVFFFSVNIILRIFFFKSVQIYMTDAEYAESKEKSNFRFFRFLFF